MAGEETRFEHIEIVWGLMARRVYENGRQFTDKMEPAEVIAEVWDNMSEEYLEDLCESTSDLLLDVCTLHGGTTRY